MSELPPPPGGAESSEESESSHEQQPLKKSWFVINISPDSPLGKLFKKFGLEVSGKIGLGVELNDVALGKESPSSSGTTPAQIDFTKDEPPPGMTPRTYKRLCKAH